MFKKLPNRKSGILYAEDLSARTGKPIGFYSTNARLDVLAPDDKIYTLKEVEILKTKPLKLPMGRYNSKGQVRAHSAVDSAKVEQALKDIGGILVTLSEGERYQVLTKLSGAFHYAPKGKVKSLVDHPSLLTSKQKASKKQTASGNVRKGKPKKEETPDQVFNKSFGKTLEGVLLKETSKIYRKVSKASSASQEKISQEVYEAHHWLLKQKSVAKQHPENTLLPYDNAEDPPGKLLDDLLSVSVILSKEIAPNGDRTLLAPIFEAGLCLIQGTVGPAISLYKGPFPPRSTWPPIPRTVQRTDEEKALRASNLLALKEKQKGKEGPALDPIIDQRGGGSIVSYAKVHFEETPEGETHSVVNSEWTEVSKSKRPRTNSAEMSF